MKRNARLAWHYTIGDRLVQILADGVIRPATASVPAHERPIVWFSLNQRWEETANKALQTPDGRLIGLDMHETGREGGGLIRIGVALDRAPHPWSALKRLSGMSNEVARGFVAAARRNGADPIDWRGTFEPVTWFDWLAVERYVDGAWIAERDPDPRSGAGLVGDATPARFGPSGSSQA